MHGMDDFEHKELSHSQSAVALHKYDFEVRSSNKATTVAVPKLTFRPVSNAASNAVDAAGEQGLLTSRTRYDRIAQTLQSLSSEADDSAVVDENKRHLLKTQQLLRTMNASQSAPDLLRPHTSTKDGRVHRRVLQSILSQIRKITSACVAAPMVSCSSGPVSCAEEKTLEHKTAFLLGTRETELDEEERKRQAAKRAQAKQAAEAETEEQPVFDPTAPRTKRAKAEQNVRDKLEFYRQNEFERKELEKRVGECACSQHVLTRCVRLQLLG